MATLLTRAWQPLRPLLAASAARPRDPDLSAALRGLRIGGGYGRARALPVYAAGAVFRPGSSAPASVACFSSSSPSYSEEPGSNAEADTPGWIPPPPPPRDKSQAPLVERRKIWRKRERIERERQKLDKILEKKGVEGLLKPKREEKLREKEAKKFIESLERRMIVSDSEEAQKMLEEHLEK